MNVLSDAKSAWDLLEESASHFAHLGLVSNQFKDGAEQTVTEFHDNIFS